MHPGSVVVVGRPVKSFDPDELPAKAASADAVKDTDYAKPQDQELSSWSAQTIWDDSETVTYDGGLTGELRANFIRKVYGILTAQMAITVVICAAAMFIPAIRFMFLRFMATPYATFIIFIPALCTLCALQARKAEHPTNYQLLFLFTVLMSISIAGVCAVYQAVGAGMLILQAFAVTMAAFGGLTLYAMKSGQDFTWMGGMLYMGLLGMIAFSLFGFLFGFNGGVLFSFFGVVLFCGYILYDTSRIMKVYGPDDAIIAAVEIYLDILNLFLYLLQLLSQCQGGQD